MLCKNSSEHFTRITGAELTDYEDSQGRSAVPTQPTASDSQIKPVWPFVFISVLSLLLAALSWVFTGLIFSIVWIVVAVLGVILAIVRSQANSAHRSATPSGPIGMTVDGRPIYPIVGYTPDGMPVTADHAVGVRTQSFGTNGLAIASLILAFFIPIVGLVLGFIARSQIAKSGQQGSGLALAGILIGGVFTLLNTVALIVLLA
ncbi:DUF4190 domain-containing protein [Gordonia sp. NPDC003585]|uniref:DUF4190 domain-containing protein n=1 Tax=Gordonia sp. NPDC003585 TaxID=3154275 RepID=UPI0033A14892